MSRSPFVRHTKRAFPENGTMTVAHLSTAGPRSSAASVKLRCVISRAYIRQSDKSPLGMGREKAVSRNSHPLILGPSPGLPPLDTSFPRASLASSRDSHARIALFFPSALSLRRVLTLSFIIVLAYRRGPDPLSSIRSISLLAREKNSLIPLFKHVRGFHD